MMTRRAKSANKHLLFPHSPFGGKVLSVVVLKTKKERKKGRVRKSDMDGSNEDQIEKKTQT